MGTQAFAVEPLLDTAGVEGSFVVPFSCNVICGYYPPVFGAQSISPPLIVGADSFADDDGSNAFVQGCLNVGSPKDGISQLTPFFCHGTSRELPCVPFPKPFWEGSDKTFEGI